MALHQSTFTIVRTDALTRLIEKLWATKVLVLLTQTDESHVSVLTIAGATERLMSARKVVDDYENSTGSFGGLYGSNERYDDAADEDEENQIAELLDADKAAKSESESESRS